MVAPEPLPFQGEFQPAHVSPATNLRERGAAAAAWCGLLAVDLLLKTAGFKRFLQVVRWWPIRRARRQDAGVGRRITAAVDRAATCYFQRAWCLQRSAAGVCLLRLRGIEAELVIGVRKLPFRAHAWVEVGGLVINNHPNVQEQYAVLERC